MEGGLYINRQYNHAYLIKSFQALNILNINNGIPVKYTHIRTKINNKMSINEIFFFFNFKSLLKIKYAT